MTRTRFLPSPKRPADPRAVRRAARWAGRVLKTAVLSAALLGPLGLSGCATPPKKERVVAEVPAGSFVVDWSVQTNTAAPTAFYFINGLLFVYDADNNVSAFDTNGALKFKIPVGEPGDILGSPVVQKERVVFPTSGTLEVYTPTGIKLKTIRIPQPIRSPGIANGDVLYAGTDSETGGRLAAISLIQPNNFNLFVWTRLTGIVHTQPVFKDNVIYCAAEDGRVYAVTTEGNRGWAAGPEIPDGVFHADGNVVAPIKFDETAVKVEEQGLYVPSTDTKLYCLAPTSGHIKWTYYAGVPLTNSPTISRDLIYQRVEGSGVVALPKKAGERVIGPLWTYEQGIQVVAFDEKNAYVLNRDGSVSAVKKTDGTVAFKTQGKDVSRAVVNLDPKNPLVYALTKDNRLVALRPVLRAGVVGELAMADVK